jgi:hypothetical protein
MMHINPPNFLMLSLAVHVITTELKQAAPRTEGRFRCADVRTSSTLSKLISISLVTALVPIFCVVNGKTGC